MLTHLDELSGFYRDIIHMYVCKKLSLGFIIIYDCAYLRLENMQGRILVLAIIGTCFTQGSVARHQTNDSIWTPVTKNIFQQGICAVIDGIEEKFFQTCVWGKNCGGSCAPYQDYGIADPGDDELDAACLQHDICLCKARTMDARRACDRELSGTASRLAEELDECTGWNKVNPLCWNDEIVCSAFNIAFAMDTVGSPDEINYSCVLHQQDDKEYEYAEEEEYEDAEEEEYEYAEEGEYEGIITYEYEEEDIKDEVISTTVNPSSTEAEALEKFNFEMDWNPSSCYKDSSCSNAKVVQAFTISEMTSRLENRDEKNSRCWKADSPEAKSLDVATEVSSGTRRALGCIFENAAGSNNDLWKDIYIRVGSCSGLSPKEYFETMVKLYSSIGLNNITNEFGVSKESNTVDRDSFMDYVSKKVGKKTWIECDPDTRILRVVLVCVRPSPPFDIIDCTMDRDDPSSSNGIPCKGELQLPMDVGSTARDECIPYMYQKDSTSTAYEMTTEENPSQVESVQGSGAQGSGPALISWIFLMWAIMSSCM